MKKRKIIGTLIVLFVISSVNLLAQDNPGSSSGKSAVFGIRAGGAFSGFTNHQDVFTSMRSGICIGAFAEYKLSSLLGLSAEVNYVQEGAFHANPFLIYPASTVNYTSSIYKTSSDIRLHTIQIPVLLNVRAPKISGNVVPKFILGYSFDFILKAISKDMYMASSSTDIPLSNRSTEDVTSSFKRMNTGPVLGLGLDFAGDKLSYMIEVRYKIGLWDTNNLGSLNALNSQYDFSVNTFTITLGIEL